VLQAADAVVPWHSKARFKALTGQLKTHLKEDEKKNGGRDSQETKPKREGY